MSREVCGGRQPILREGRYVGSVPLYPFRPEVEQTRSLIRSVPVDGEREAQGDHACGQEAEPELDSVGVRILRSTVVPISF
jgi:hypothetical protein